MGNWKETEKRVEDGMNENKRRKLPAGWRWTSLGNTDLISIIMGQSPPGETYNKEKIGLPFFQGCADFGNIYPEPTVWCSKPKKIAEPKDILLSVRAPVGPTNVAKEKCCIGRGIAALRSKEGLTYKYLKWILRKFEKQISSGGSGSIFNAIGNDEIKDIIFPLPTTLDDQIAIADKLERKMAEIEKMRQAALSQKEAIAAMQGAILRGIFISAKNEQWHLTNISKIAHITMGQSPDGSTYNLEGTGVPLLNGPTEFGKEHPTPVQWTTSPKKLCQAGDLIVCVRGNTTGKMNLADQNYCLGRGVAGVRGKEGKGDTNFLRAALDFKIKELLAGTERSTFPNLGKDELNSFAIFVPKNLALQKKNAKIIKEKLDTVNNVTNLIKNQSKAIEALPGALLREMFDFEEVQED